MVAHTRASNHPLLEFDPEAGRTHLRNLRQALENLRINNMAENRTLRDLTNPNLNQQPLAVTVPALNEGVTFELKSGVINLLPKFHGLAGEDPIMHLSEFHDICMCSKPSNVTEEQIKMRAFGFTLKDAARNWYYHLPAGAVNTWADLYKAFLGKYFPAKKTAAVKKAIANFEQKDDESLYDCCERFTKLRASCPFLGFDMQDLVLFLYNGLLDNERRMIDAACCGSIMNLTPTAAMDRMQDIAEGTRSFGRTYTKKGVSAVNSSNQELKDEMAELKSMVKEVIKSIQYQPQQNNQYQPDPHALSTEDKLQILTQDFNAHVQKTESSITDIQRKMGQLADTMGQISQAVSALAQRQSNSLPAQTEVNPQSEECQCHDPKEWKACGTDYRGGGHGKILGRGSADHRPAVAAGRPRSRPRS